MQLLGLRGFISNDIHNDKNSADKVYFVHYTSL
jgi:hypothetical protein